MASRSLGVLTLDLIAKIGGFTGPLDQAGRHADARMRAMERRAKEFGHAIGVTLGAALTAGSAAFAIYIKNTIEAEKVQAQLGARLKDTGMAAGRSLEQLNAQAEKLQRLTIFDDETIGQAQAALLTFKQIQGLNFDRAVEASTDLATVMGVDLEQAARTLGKALNDPERGIGQLRKAGIALTEDQVKLIDQLSEMGRTAEAQTVLLDALSTTMGTAAEASRDTLGGALQGLQNSFNNLLEGDAGDNGVRGTKQAIDQLAATLDSEQVHQGFNSMVNGLARVAEVAATTLTAIANLTMGVDAFGRSAGEVEYQAGLRREQQLSEQVANGGPSPFEPNYGTSLAQLKSELQAQRNLNEAYRRSSQRQAARSLPSMGLPENGTSIVFHDPDLWGGGGGRKGGIGRATDAHREAEKAVRDLAQAHSELGTILDAQAREMGGPLLSAAQDYRDELTRIQGVEDELSRLGKLDADAQAQLATAREQAAAGYQKQADAIQNVKSPLLDVIEAQERELRLLGLTGPALQTASDLYGASAADIEKFGAAIEANNHRIEEMRKTIDTMDDLRNSFEGIFLEVAKGQMSLIDGLKAFADAFISQLLRMAAAQASAALWGQPGTAGGGVLGNVFGSILSAFTGGFAGGASGFKDAGNLKAFASGTDYAPGGWALVGEHGPELVNLPQGAQVLPAGETRRRTAGSGGFSPTIINNYQTPTDPRTRSQVSNDLSRVMRQHAVRS